MGRSILKKQEAELGAEPARNLPPELKRGQRLGEMFMSVVRRDKHGVFEACFAAQVILTWCRETMGQSRAQAWNEYINDLLASLRYQ